MNRKLKLFIAVSVVLNIVLIGVIAGHSYQRYSMNRGNQIIALLENSSIAEEKRKIIKAKLQEGFNHNKNRQEHKKWQEETIAILTAENFDVEAYRSQLDKIVLKYHGNKKQKIEAIIELAVALNYEERIGLAEIFRKSRK